MFYKDRIFKELIFTYIILVFLGVGFFTYDRYQYMHKSLDNKLYDSIMFYQELFPKNYHDKIKKSYYSAEEYLKLIERNNILCKKINIQYLWSVIERDGNIYFTSSTSTNHQVEGGQYALFYQKHNDPSSFKEALDSMLPTYSTFENEWGKGRQLLVPYKNKKGEKYVFGISQSYDVIWSSIVDATIHNALVGIVILLLGAYATYFIFYRVHKESQVIYDLLNDFFNKNRPVARNENDLQRIELGLKLILESRMDFSNLLKEVNHRVKNIYQFLSSFLAISINDIEDPGAKKVINNVRNAILGMSILHENIYDGEQNIKKYIFSLMNKLHLAFYFGSTEPKVHLWACSENDAELTPEKNINVGMILNELFLNSMNAGIKTGRPKDMYVFVCVRSEDILIGYCDLGDYYTQGHILNPQKRGVGTLLVESMMSKLDARRRVVPMKVFSGMMNREVSKKHPELAPDTYIVAFSFPVV